MYSHFGYNLKATEMQAAVGVQQLGKLPAFIKARRQNWSYLREHLDPLGGRLILPEPARDSLPSWFGFLISVRAGSGLDRNQVTRYLEQRNIQTRLLFSGNIIRHPCFDPIRGTDAYRIQGGLAHSDFITEHTFWVGVYPGMTKEKLDYLIQAIEEAAGRK